MFEWNRFNDDGPNYFEVAQVCLNGHVITGAYNENPERRKDFCPKCGSKTIFQCPKCQANIQGDYIVPSVPSGGISHPPAYCHSCGQAYPWIEMQLEAARQLTIEAEELSEDRDKLINSLPDLVSDTARTTIAANRWRKAFEKMGKYTAITLQEIFVDIASETAKKLLFPK